MKQFITKNMHLILIGLAVLVVYIGYKTIYLPGESAKTTPILKSTTPATSEVGFDGNLKKTPVL